jgi:hypothetical protein
LVRRVDNLGMNRFVQEAELGGRRLNVATVCVVFVQQVSPSTRAGRRTMRVMILYMPRCDRSRSWVLQEMAAMMGIVVL